MRTGRTATSIGRRRVARVLVMGVNYEVPPGTGTQGPPIRLPEPIWAGSAKPKVDSDPLIRGLIPRDALIVTFGASGSSKTVHVLERDIRIASGLPFYDREVSQGIVLYIPTEGRNSLINRLCAYRSNRLADDADTLLAILPAQIDLLDPGTAETLIDYGKKLAEEQGVPLVKVTIDTLSRSIPGGDENSAVDMTRAIQTVDRVRHALGCAVELVHHAGKDSAKGARGHSALRAACDVEIEVAKKDDVCVAKVTKQRDLETGGEFAYHLEVIELGRDRWGHPITTVIPDWIVDHVPKKPESYLAEQPGKLLWMLREAIEMHGEFLPSDVYKRADKPPKMNQKGMSSSKVREWVEERGGISTADKADTRAHAVRRALQTLQAKGFIQYFAEWVWLTDKADMRRTS